MTVKSKQILSRLRERLSEPAVLDLPKRWIATPRRGPVQAPKTIFHYAEAA